MARVAQTPGRPAVQVGDLCVSYAALAAQVCQLAAELPLNRPSKPARILVRQRDPFSMLVHILTCWCRGAVPVILRDGTTETHLEELKARLRPVAMLLDAVPPSVRPMETITADRPRSLDLRDEALVICTSGTTGHPKLVALPAESICRNAVTIGTSLGLTPEDRVAVNTPLGYMYGLMGGCIAALWSGASILLFPPQIPLPQVQATLRRLRGTVVQGPPSLLRLFLAYWNGEPFPDVRTVTTGGESISDDLRETLARAFPSARILFLYGMTEAGPRIAHESLASGGGRDGCIGHPYPHLEWRIDPTGSDAAPSATGRLVLRGPSLFLGYLGPGNSYEGLDAAGWFHTNDLVSMAPDGRLHFRGRTDRLFKCGGKLVNPEDVERVLRLHPGVEDARCYPEVHEILGFVPVAEVLAKTGCRIELADVLRFCQTRLEHHARPRRLVPASGGELAESGKRKHIAPPG